MPARPPRVGNRGRDSGRASARDSHCGVRSEERPGRRRARCGGSGRALSEPRLRGSLKDHGIQDYQRTGTPPTRGLCRGRGPRTAPTEALRRRASKRRRTAFCRSGWESSGFRGDAGKTLLLNDIPGCRAKRVLVVGCGKSKTVSEADYRRALRAAMNAMGSAGVRRAGSYLDGGSRLRIARGTGRRGKAWRPRSKACTASTAARVRSSGRARASRCFHFRRTKTPRWSRAHSGMAPQSRRAVRLAKDLGNLPGNLCTPSFLADEARQLAARHDAVETTVRDEAELERLGMGSLLSVARGSREPACLIEMQYRGAPRSQAPIVLVGKGVTFDSGGISIKPSGGDG